MRILLNDFSGHPFPVQLSRELAGRGYTVLHTYCASFLTPHGSLQLDVREALIYSVSRNRETATGFRPLLETVPAVCRDSRWPASGRDDAPSMRTRSAAGTLRKQSLPGPDCGRER